MFERTIHEALQADEQRRIRLQQLPVQAVTPPPDLASQDTIQRLVQVLRQIGEMTREQEVRQLVEAALFCQKETDSLGEQRAETSERVG